MRHGKTDWNEQHKLQGRTDIPLNETGRKMAENAAIEYKDIHFDVCYCSPLIRAKETAEIFFRDKDTPIITDDRLKEMGFGIYEGSKNCFKHPEWEIYTLFKHPENYTASFENGETFEELYARTGEFLREVIYPELEKNKDILIIGHGAMNSSIICQIRNIPIENFWLEGIENCKLIKLK